MIVDADPESTGSVPSPDSPPPSGPGDHPTNDLPDWPAFTAAARDGEWDSPARASKRTPLGGDAAIAIVRTQKGKGEAAEWRISLVRLERDEGAWKPAGSRVLESWSAHPVLERDGTIAARLRVEDFDADGQLEVSIRYRLSWMCCGAGATTRRTLVVLNDDETLSESAYLHLDEEVYFGGTKGREGFEDRNEDGHPDLVVSWSATYDDEPPEKGERVHEWLERGDRFKGAKRATGEECTCE